MFDEILNSFDAADNALGQEIDKVHDVYDISDSVVAASGKSDMFEAIRFRKTGSVITFVIITKANITSGKILETYPLPATTLSFTCYGYDDNVLFTDGYAYVYSTGTGFNLQLKSGLSTPGKKIMICGTYICK